MVDRIRRFQVLNSQIFSMLSKYLSSGQLDGNQVEQVKCFNPPSFPKPGKKKGGFMHVYYSYIILYILSLVKNVGASSAAAAAANAPIYMRTDILLQQKHQD